MALYGHLLRAASLLAGLSLAGCADDDGDGLGQHGAMSVQYSGQEAGEHSDSGGCDDEGTLSGSANVQDGQVTVTVTDGSGSEVFSETYRERSDLDGERLNGASGDWTLRAVRTGDDLLGDSFNGDYTFTVAC